MLVEGQVEAKVQLGRVGVLSDLPTAAPLAARHHQRKVET